MPKSAYEMAAARDITGWAILLNGEHAGNLLTVYGSGGGVTGTLSIWAGPLKTEEGQTGRALGGGYCKRSAAIAHASYRMCEAARQLLSGLDGTGLNAIRTALESKGYTVAEVL